MEEVFGLTRFLFILMSICEPPKGTSIPLRCFYWCFTIFYLGLHSLGLVGGILFGLRALDLGDIEGALFGLAEVAGCSNAAFSTFGGVFYRKHFTRTLDRYVELHKKEPELGLPKYLDKANRTCQRITLYFIYYIIWSYVMSILLVVVIITYCMLTDGYVDQKFFFTPLKFRLPWNQNCLSGWLAEQAFTIAYAGAFLNVLSAFLSFIIGISMHHDALTSFIRSLQLKIDEQLDAGQFERNEVKYLLRKSIDTYNLAKDLFEETKTLFSRFYFIQLIGSMIQLSADIFQLDMGFRHPSMDLYMTTVALTSSAAVLFLNCFFGERSTNYYLDMAEHYYMVTKWYELPMDLQKYYIILIQSAQRPIYYDGLGIAYLNIPTFGRIIRTVISYYITFRTLVE